MYLWLVANIWPMHLTVACIFRAAGVHFPVNSRNLVFCNNKTALVSSRRYEHGGRSTTLEYIVTMIPFNNGVHLISRVCIFLNAGLHFLSLKILVE